MEQKEVKVIEIKGEPATQSIQYTPQLSDMMLMETPYEMRLIQLNNAIYLDNTQARQLYYHLRDMFEPKPLPSSMDIF